MQRTFVFRSAAIAAIVGLVVSVASTAHASAGLNTSTIKYECSSLAGVQRIQVRVTVRDIVDARPGHPFNVGPVKVVVSALAATGQPPTQIRLGVAAVQGGQRTDAQWPPLPLSYTGGRVSTQADVPAITASDQGVVRLVVGNAELLSQSDRILCRPIREITIGEISVSDRNSPRHSGVTPSRQLPAAGAGTAVTCVRPPGGQVFSDPDIEPNPPPPPPYNPPDSPIHSVGYRDCTLVTAITNAPKQKGAIVVQGSAQAVLELDEWSGADPQIPSQNFFYQRGYGVTAMQPATATLLGFGFMPTTATARITQTENANLDFNGTDAARWPTVYEHLGHAQAKIKVSVSSLDVNGTAVPVGSSCGSAGGAVLILADHSGIFDPLAAGGIYVPESSNPRNTVIPRFEGCGVNGEDLSPLLTASVSGVESYTMLWQGPVCQPDDASTTCSAKQLTQWTVKPGGDFTLTAAPFTMAAAPTSVTCSSATLDLTVQHARHQTGFRLARVKNATFTGCVRKFGRTTVPTNITAHALPWEMSIPDLNGPPVTNFNIVGFTVDTVGADGCSLAFDPENTTKALLSGVYSNETGDVRLIGPAFPHGKPVNCPKGVWSIPAGSWAYVNSLFSAHPIQTFMPQ